MGHSKASKADTHARLVEAAAAAREKASKAKDAKRLIPSPSSQAKSSSVDTNLGPASEENAAESMNRRRPLDSIGDTAWTARDDVTLGSREGSRDREKERHRENEIDALKQTLLKRESTRGRRKAGETVPRLPGMSGVPGVSLTGASPNREGFGAVDEEAEVGLGLGMYAGAGYGQQSASGNAGYSMFPPVAQQQKANPLGSQPVGSAGASTSGQGRNRGASFGVRTPGGSSGSG